MTRKELFRSTIHIICKGCNTMKPCKEFYVMFELGGAYESLFKKEIKEDTHWATCDDCCGDKFVERINKYINE